MKKNLVFVAGSLVLLGGAIWYVFPQEKQSRFAERKALLQEQGSIAEEPIPTTAHFTRSWARAEEPSLAAEPSGPSRPEAGPDEARAEAPEDAQARVISEKEAQQTWFEKEQVDTYWARLATRSFQADLESLKELEALKESGFSIQTLECKTSVCKAEVTFEHPRFAREGAAAIAHKNYATNCGVAVYALPAEPSHADSPYPAEVYFDCTDLRSGNL